MSFQISGSILELTRNYVAITEDEHEFTYLNNSSKGPEHWGTLKEEWKLCSIGKFQSPIDILEEKVLVWSELGKLGRKYRAAHAILKNRGHDMMVRQCSVQIALKNVNERVEINYILYD